MIVMMVMMMVMMIMMMMPMMDDDDAADDNKPVQPTWAVGTLLGVRNVYTSIPYVFIYRISGVLGGEGECLTLLLTPLSSPSQGWTVSTPQ
jgi:hypothetical protein